MQQYRDAPDPGAITAGAEVRDDQVRQAIDAAVRAFGYSGCAGQVAQEFGDLDTTCVDDAPIVFRAYDLS